jgi:hypothetical protein
MEFALTYFVVADGSMPFPSLSVREHFGKS